MLVFRPFVVMMLSALLLTACGGSGGSGGGSGGGGYIVSGYNTELSLSWQAPVSRSDGSAISPGEIRSYRIYFGLNSGEYVSVYEITDGSTQVILQGVPPGDYFVVVTAVDGQGRESAYSEEILKAVNLS